MMKVSDKPWVFDSEPSGSVGYCYNLDGTESAMMQTELYRLGINHVCAESEEHDGNYTITVMGEDSDRVERLYELTQSINDPEPGLPGLP